MRAVGQSRPPLRLSLLGSEHLLYPGSCVLLPEVESRVPLERRQSAVGFIIYSGGPTAPQHSCDTKETLTARRCCHCSSSSNRPATCLKETLQDELLCQTHQQMLDALLCRSQAYRHTF